MRKAFTLIELMMTILIMTIFLNFVFRFYSNVLMEVRYLEAKDSLTYNAFRALQIIKNGVFGNGGYIDGVITLKDRIDDNNFTSYNGNSITIDTPKDNLKISTNSNSYIFNDLNITDFILKPISNNLYLIEFNASKKNILTGTELNQTDFTTYQRLVYTR